MPYIALTLIDVDLGLTALFEKHGKALAETNTGKTYGKLLRETLTELHALPRADDGTRPLADELAAKDAQHDGYGAAIWYAVEAHVRAPSTSESDRKALVTVRDALVSSLLALRAPYADEAAAAREHRKTHAEHRALLRAYPVTKKLTLEDWVLAYIEAGEALGALLVARSEQTPAPRTKAGRLRSRVLGLLTRFREGLGDELGGDPERSEELDRAFFAYFDQLEAQRAEANVRSASAGEEGEGGVKKEGEGGVKKEGEGGVKEDTGQGTDEKHPKK